MKRSISILSTLLVLALLTGLMVPGLAKAALAIPTISIVSVDPGKTVTISTQNFPANDSFDVLMGKFGTRGVGGTKVETVSSGKGGVLSFTFKVPAALAAEKQIAIRLQSAKSGYYSYNWFWNVTGTPGVPNTGDQPGSIPAGTIPTIAIVSVDAGKTVTIRTSNYPANDSYDVLMGKIGTRGVGGTKVETVSSGKGGTMDFTFKIPAGLVAEKQIAIRLQSAKTGYYSYNWFWNATGTPGVPNTGDQPGTIPPGTIPTISIAAVDPGKTVKVTTTNFPARNSFNVLMGKMGTRGVGGIKVETVDSGTGGTLTFTFNIPASLAAEKQIAIRLEAPATGYYSYNWFWNVAGTPGVPNTGNQPPAGTVPTFTITGVVRDGTVTIQTANFPANDTFDVYMNTMGTQGVGGTKVETVSSGTGGKLSFTFNIPAGLKGQQQIAVRLQSPTSGYYSYNWFWNNTYP